MSNTLSDKTNKSIADIANKIMQEQPTKIRDFADSKPIESDMVQRVMNLKVPNHFVKEAREISSGLKTKLRDSNSELADRHKPTETQHGNITVRSEMERDSHMVTAHHDGELIATHDASTNRGTQYYDHEMGRKAALAISSHLKTPAVRRNFPNSRQYKVFKEEVEQIDEALDHEVNNYAKHMLNAHSADDLHVGNEHRDMAHQTLKHIEKHYGPVGVRWAEARAGEHIENHNKAQRDAEKASVMKHYKPTPPGAKVYQYPKSEVKEGSSYKSPPNSKGGQLPIDKSPPNSKGGQLPPYKNPPKGASNQMEEAEQVDEGRFGRAIDRSKLSAAARARLEARDKKAGKEAPKAEPAPTSAAVGKRAGRAAPKAKESPMAALAQSFGAKKKAAPNAAPEKEETPAQKVRRQNIERQKEFYAKGGSGGINVGSGGRTSITGHNTSTAGGAVNAVKSQGRIKTGGLHSIAVDEELKGNQTALDVAKPYGKLTAQDFKALRAKHKKGN